MARELNEQWIEEIDGKKHMFKAVTPIINGHPDIKDLGVLNEDGLLPCPFCGSDVNIGKSATLPGGCIMLNFICTNCDNQVQVSSDSVQHCADAFNRRA